MDLPRNKLKQALAEGRVQTGLWLGFAHPMAAEIASQAGFDWCLIDGEHGPNDVPLILSQLQAMNGCAASPVVRVPVGEEWLLKQVLDIGAQSVLVPLIDTVEHAERIVRAVRYAPSGIRGMGAGQARASGYGAVTDYVAKAGTEICLLVQAETRRAIEAVAEIAALDGIDGVFIGPADLSADMGYPGQPDAPEVVAAIEAAIPKIRAAGKAAGIITFDPAQVAHYARLGITFLGVGGDVALFANACRGLAAKARKAVA